MRPGFFTDNASRDYPFLADSTGAEAPSLNPGDLQYLPTETIVDAGFMLGLRSGYIEGLHSVWLTAIWRQADTFFFSFSSDSPGLLGVPLTFCRKLTDEWFSVEHRLTYGDEVVDSSTSSSNYSSSDSSRDSSSNSSSDSSLIDDHICLRDELWSGFLVVGSLLTLADLIKSGERLDGAVFVEPGILRSLVGSRVQSVNLANADRTRASAPDQCKPLCWDYELGEIFVAARCLQGPLRFRGGYNCSVRQNDIENLISFSAVVGGGEGRSCDEVPLFAGETPPVGGQLLDGSVSCYDAIRTINGSGGARVEILAGVGVALTVFPTENRLLVDIDLRQLQVCLDTSESSNDQWPDLYGGEECDCGPVEI